MSTERLAPIPVAWCVGTRELSEPRLSPDGTAIVFAVSHDREAFLSVRPLDGSPVRRFTTAPQPRVGRGMGGGCWCWSADGAAVVYAAVDGNLWWQPLDASASHQLTDHGPERVVQAPCATVDGRRVVYVVDQAEVWSLDLHDRSSTRLDDGGADFCFDPAVMPCSSGAVWQAWNVPDMPWDRARLVQARFDEVATTGMTTEMQPLHSVQQPRFLPDGAAICVRDDTGWLNLWVRDRPLVDEPFEHAGPSWGLGQRSFASSPTGTHVAFTRNEGGFGRLCTVELDSGRVVELGRGVHGQLSWVGARIAALRSGARTPTEIVVYDLQDATGGGAAAGRSVEVAATPGWPKDRLVEPELVEVDAADGGVIRARRYRADPVPDGEPVVRRMICWLHGGPTDQWQVSFMPRIAYWRSRGWDVVVPDHRGSTGHGRLYQQALRGRWGELDVDDIATVLRHAQTQGWTTPERTVLIGGSAGGFTVLGVLAAHPGSAACAVVAYPVADLADLAERSHRFERHYTWSLVGEPGGSPEIDQRYRDRSPAWFGHRITTPLLVFHGEDDHVVPVDQSTVLVERIRVAGGTVELCVYPGEGHGFRQVDHQRDEYERTAAFLQLHVS